jgi:hypothetical protein
MGKLTKPLFYEPLDKEGAILDNTLLSDQYLNVEGLSNQFNLGYNSFRIFPGLSTLEESVEKIEVRMLSSIQAPIATRLTKVTAQAGLGYLVTVAVFPETVTGLATLEILVSYNSGTKVLWTRKVVVNNQYPTTDPLIYITLPELKYRTLRRYLQVETFSEGGSSNNFVTQSNLKSGLDIIYNPSSSLELFI